MLTKIGIKNFKRLTDEEFALDGAVVLVGPNNSGKTSTLQAIALWEIGMQKWAENRLKTKSKAKQRTGVTINRKDVIAVPVPSALQLWKDLRVSEKTAEDNQKPRQKNIRIEIYVEGFTKGKQWNLGFEFDYANPESFYCRILKSKNSDDVAFPTEALEERIGFLPPMSGLTAEEDKFELGSILRRVGEGRTAEVLRNLCWIIWEQNKIKWEELTTTMKTLFGIDLDPPIYDKTAGRISMTYKEGKTKMDLSNVGRGFQQILLLLSYIYAGQNTILLLDEPDAHLEIIRQRQIYNLLTDVAKKEGAQIIIATHSEVLVDEAVERDKIIAFLGKPHIVNDRSQLVKSLTTIGFDQYLLAEQKKWVLYLEGSTDLSILKAFAKVLQHPIKDYLEDPFVKYVSNNPQDARNHFYGLKEAMPELKGIAIFDHLDRPLQGKEKLTVMMWQRREIENYLPIPMVIERYIEKQPHSLFHQHKPSIMSNLIKDHIPHVALEDKTDSWWYKTKISDDFLDKIFKKYSEKIKTPILMNKSNYYELALLANPDELDPEIKEKLDAIMKTIEKE